MSTIDWSSLPKPEDDGAANQLQGKKMPALALQATNGSPVALNELTGTSVIYIYPLTAEADGSVPDGWDGIPGARGCTPQSCAFRDHYAELKALGVDHLFGLSVQTSDYQKEAAKRLHLPFSLLSDAEFKLTEELQLPTFTTGEKKLLKRMALILKDAVISKIFYPVFPPDENAQQVIDFLKNPS